MNARALSAHHNQMNAAIRDCITDRRPVSPLNKAWEWPKRDVPQKWRDEAREHLAVRSDAS